ncbi:helix-turn-helix domain-containing protein [Streptomyces sp. MK37H]|uniref:helix-turn-helix domain-containing protein n=1 Tax=Streptomyces sp. MK37H TaxID=2699117 RepID=UPI001B3606E9|nr:helix-turn-helix domain-containing protein [Streptomyces sp. MK37H]MBP8536128.1 helix-turn-helix domain-containing protein [Streptomyces sp. MK37H]
MVEETRDQLSRLVRDRRAELGISLAKVAQASGDPDLAPSWINRLEHNQLKEIPNKARLEALGRGLQLPPRRLARAAGAQYWGLAEEYSQDESARVIVDHLEDLSGPEKRQLQAMVEAFARNRRPEQ